MTWGDHTVGAFNSDWAAPIQTQQGPLELDWYVDVRKWSPVGFLAPFAYSVGKLLWTGFRWKAGAEIGYYWPFQDPGETGAVMYIIEGKSFRDIFSEEYLARECPIACGGE